MKKKIKAFLLRYGVSLDRIMQSISGWSISCVVHQRGWDSILEKMRGIVTDISHQETSESQNTNSFWDFKRRTLQAFQCTLMLKAVERFYQKGKIKMVDLGDSAGTHILYLKGLTKGKLDIDSLSINLDPHAIERIKSKGLPAILSRVEDLNLDGKKVDLFVSFEMLEHLHNPAGFLRHLAKDFDAETLAITVPYLHKSRVGLHCTREGKRGKIFFAEDEHVFELSPQDWKLLMLHAGWRVVHSEVYYQYPRWPIVGFFLSLLFKEYDFEGFWGAILEKDTSISDMYQNWETKELEKI